MAWIRILEPHEATGELAELYTKIKRADGGIDHILSIHSLRPRSLHTHYELYKDLMYGPSELSRVQREMVAIVVSVSNHCQY